MKLKPWQIGMHGMLFDQEAAGGAPAADAGAKPPEGGAPPPADAGSAPPASDPSEPSAGLRTDANAVPDNFNDMYKSHILSQFPEGDERSKAEAYLQRRASPVDVVRSGMNADARIQELTDSANQRIKPPTPDSSPEELQAFRVAMGIPDSHTEYKGFRPEGREFTPAETQMEQNYFQFAHENNMTPDQVQKNMAFLDAYQTKQAEEWQAQVKQASERAEDQLRVKYGTDFRDKKALGESYLKAGLAPHLGGNAELGDLLNKRFEDGTALGENPAFFGWVIDMATDAQDGGAFDFNSTGGGGGPDGEARLKELRAMAHSSDSAERAAYATEGVQQEIKQLVARQMRQQQRR